MQPFAQLEGTFIAVFFKDYTKGIRTLMVMESPLSPRHKAIGTSIRRPRAEIAIPFLRLAVVPMKLERVRQLFSHIQPFRRLQTLF